MPCGRAFDCADAYNLHCKTEVHRLIMRAQVTTPAQARGAFRVLAEFGHAVTVGVLAVHTADCCDSWVCAYEDTPVTLGPTVGRVLRAALGDS